MRDITSITEGFTVIGLTEDVPDRSLREVPEPLVMAPLAQMPAGNITWTALTFVLRTAGGDPLRLAPAVRREIWAINPNIVISEIATMDERVARTIRTERDSALLFGLFAVAALVMAAVGVYGVAAYAIAQRTKEIGIRIALGAARRDVPRLVVSQTLAPTMIGIATWRRRRRDRHEDLSPRWSTASRRWIRRRSPWPRSCSSRSRLTATWLPARRAMRTDPLIALRSQ